jgi:hypothetical protein
MTKNKVEVTPSPPALDESMAAEVRAYKRIGKGNLVGLADVSLAGVLLIHGCPILRSGDQIFCALSTGMTGSSATTTARSVTRACSSGPAAPPVAHSPRLFFGRSSTSMAGMCWNEHYTHSAQAALHFALAVT